METTRQNKISRLLQKELSEIFLLQTKAMPGTLVSVSAVRISPDIVKRSTLKFAHGDHLRFVESLSVCGSQRRSVHLANLLIPHFDYTTERDA